MKKIFIIAEAGVNHNGSSDIAKELIDALEKKMSELQAVIDVNKKHQ